MIVVLESALEFVEDDYAWITRAVMAAADQHCDGRIVAALEAGLEAYQGKPLLNSVTGEEERLEAVFTART